MKAAVLYKLNTLLMVMGGLEVPNLDIGHVLVEVHSSGICGKQIGEISGHFGTDMYLPHLLGHEGGGVVSEIGAGVTTVKKGDHVVMHWRKGVGIESKPPVYKYDNIDIGAGLITTLNDYAVVSENRLTKIDNDMPFNIAALMGCAVTTALGIINNEAQLKIGQSIAIFGCGGVGLNVIQGAAMVSANPIIAIDRIDKKLDLANAFGATHTINTESMDVQDALFSIMGKQKIDICIDCTGNVNLIDLAYNLTASKGKLILVGQPAYNEKLIINNMAKNYDGKQMFASQGGLTNPTVDIPRYLNLYKKGKLNLDKLITHTFELDKINEALDTVRRGETGRCMITMNRG